MPKDDETVLNDALLIEEREKAIHIETRDGKKVWLPRSQISHLYKSPYFKADKRVIDVTIPDWLADAKEL